MSTSFHGDADLIRTEMLLVVDADMLRQYREAAARCNPKIQIVEKATEGQSYPVAGGMPQIVIFGSTLIAVMIPTEGLSQFWEKVSEVSRESLGDGEYDK